jgi:hypothetical protein
MVKTLSGIAQFDPIENLIANGLVTFSKQVPKNSNNSTWTKGILELVRNVGRSQSENYSFCPDPDENQSEWLYDLIWYENNTKNCLINVPLVLECEWSYNWGHVKYDFEKLLIANAQYRVMICQMGKNEMSQWWENFEATIDGYMPLNKGSRFLIAILDDYDGDEFDIKVIIKE